MATIDYFFGTISPWAYLAGDRLERIAAARGASIVYRPLDVLQLFDRTGGVRPEARHQSRLDYRAQELPRWADYLGIPLNVTPRTGRPSWSDTTRLTVSDRLLYPSRSPLRGLATEYMRM